MITAKGSRPEPGRLERSQPGIRPLGHRARRRGAILLTVLALAAPAGGWARSSHPAQATRADPWEGFNRRMFALNQKADRFFIRPLAKVTSGLTPGPIGKAIRNFLVNLDEPAVILNDLLQARPGPALRSAFRLVVNTTVGALGAIDVAKALGDPAHVNGFGDTLGRWGATAGPYLVLPVIGPSDVRDLLGSLVDDAALPLRSVNYPYRTEVTITLTVVGGLNERQMVDRDLTALLADATDPYATLRSTYLQSREAQIRGEAAIPATLPDIEDAPAASPAPATKPGEGVDSPAAPATTGSPSPDGAAAPPPAADPPATPSPPSTGAPPTSGSPPTPASGGGPNGVSPSGG